MDNILVVDRERSSGFLIKSILLGRGCGVSIAATLRDARLKLHTGLFDALVLDVSEPENELPLVEEAVALLPGFPIVALFRDDPQSGPFVSLRKPIRVHTMSDALRHALGRSPSAWNRHNLDVPAVVSVGAEFVECRTTALSKHGVLLTGGPDFDRMRRFHEFFHHRLDGVIEGRIAFPGGEESFHAHAAYAELTPDQKCRQVGLVLDEDREWFGKLVAAEAGESPAVQAP